MITLAEIHRSNAQSHEPKHPNPQPPATEECVTWRDIHDTSGLVFKV